MDTTPTSTAGEPNKGIAIISYFLFFLPYLTGHIIDKFVMFHANQALILTIAWFALTFIPILGWLLNIVVFIFWIMGIVSAANSQTKPLPIIGNIHLLNK